MYREGLVIMLGLNLRVSHYSRLSHRGGVLEIKLNTLKKQRKNTS